LADAIFLTPLTLLAVPTFESVMSSTGAPMAMEKWADHVEGLVSAEGVALLR
jgi:hypothetical protein